MTFEEGEKLLLYAGNGMSHKYTQKQLDHLFARARLRIIKKMGKRALCFDTL